MHFHRIFVCIYNSVPSKTDNFRKRSLEKVHKKEQSKKIQAISLNLKVKFLFYTYVKKLRTAFTFSTNKLSLTIQELLQRWWRWFLKICLIGDINRANVQRQDLNLIPQERYFQIDFYKESEIVWRNITSVI